VEDALRRCVEAGGGVKLKSVTETRDFRLVKDVIRTKTAGYVKRYDVLKENPDQQGLFTVRVEAVVARGDIHADIDAFKTLIERKGRPRVLVVGSVDGEPFNKRLTAELQGQLEERGVDVLDTARLEDIQRKQAVRAAKGEGKPKKAALIAQKLGADVLAVATVQGEMQAAQETYGVKSYPATAVGILKLIRADTAQVLGSEVVEKTKHGLTTKKASRKATSAVMEMAMDRALQRIAQHWLEEVDQRGGQAIRVVMHEFPFKRVRELVQSLRQVDGVKQVIIDRTDAQATGQLRVVTNSSAANLGMALTEIDGQIEVVSTSKNKIEVK